MGAIRDAALIDIKAAQVDIKAALIDIKSAEEELFIHAQLQHMSGAYSKLLASIPTLINKEKNLLKRAINRRSYLRELKNVLINPLIIYLHHVVSSMNAVTQEDTVDRLNEYIQNINSFESDDRKKTLSYTLAVVMLRHVMHVGTHLYSNACISTEITYRLNLKMLIGALDASDRHCCVYKNMNNPLDRSAFRFAFSTNDDSRHHLKAPSFPPQRTQSPVSVFELSPLKSKQ